MNPVSSEDRRKVMGILKEYAGVRPPPYDPNHNIVTLAESSTTTLYAAMVIVNELANIGAIIPGKRNTYSIYGHTVKPFDDPSMFNWPNFIVTSFGQKYLSDESTNGGSSDADEYTDLLRSKMPDIPDTAQQYASEAKRAFDRGLWLAVSVLLGVASESILEKLYTTVTSHLGGQRQAQFSKSMQSPSAKGRYEIFCKELEVHKKELSRDSQERFDSLLHGLVGSLKLNRDDVAHQRTARIDQDTAMMGIHSLPALAVLVRELMDELAAPCAVTSQS